jgi:sulfofructosephosphate aldolase
VHSFVELARRAEVLAVLEGIVRPDESSWRSTTQLDDAIVDAAGELAALGADLYKAEMPGSPTEPASIEAGACRISAVLNIPWVVLSNGVPTDAFADAVAAACVVEQPASWPAERSGRPPPSRPTTQEPSRPTRFVDSRRSGPACAQ